MTLLSGLVNQTIDTVYSVTEDRWGDTTDTATFTDVKCRWQESVRKMFMADSEDLISKVQVWIYPEYSSIQEGWKITKGSDTYTVGIREPRYDLSGTLDHIKLYLV